MYPCMRHLKKNETAIISAIAEAYETGLLDDPSHASSFINILALVCEDKIEGNVDEDGINKWRLTDWYADQIENLRDSIGF